MSKKKGKPTNRNGDIKETGDIETKGVGRMRRKTSDSEDKKEKDKDKESD